MKNQSVMPHSLNQWKVIFKLFWENLTWTQLLSQTLLLVPFLKACLFWIYFRFFSNFIIYFIPSDIILMLELEKKLINISNSYIQTLWIFYLLFFFFNRLFINFVIYILLMSKQYFIWLNLLFSEILKTRELLY